MEPLFAFARSTGMKLATAIMMSIGAMFRWQIVQMTGAGVGHASIATAIALALWIRAIRSAE